MSEPFYKKSRDIESYVYNLIATNKLNLKDKFLYDYLCMRSCFTETTYKGIKVSTNQFAASQPQLARVMIKLGIFEKERQVRFSLTKLVGNNLIKSKSIGEVKIECTLYTICSFSEVLNGKDCTPSSFVSNEETAPLNCTPSDPTQVIDIPSLTNVDKEIECTPKLHIEEECNINNISYIYNKDTIYNTEEVAASRTASPIADKENCNVPTICDELVGIYNSDLPTVVADEYLSDDVVFEPSVSDITHLPTLDDSYELPEYDYCLNDIDKIKPKVGKFCLAGTDTPELICSDINTIGEYNYTEFNKYRCCDTCKEQCRNKLIVNRAIDIEIGLQKEAKFKAKPKNEYFYA